MSNKTQQTTQPKSHTLSLGHVPDAIDQSAVVEVPEFGTDEDGAPWTVNVRPLTVLTNNILTAKAHIFDRDKNGQVMSIRKSDHDETCIVTALCSYDDNGNLVFGVDFDDAITRVESLHTQYRPAIIRIARKALALSEAAGGHKAAVKNAKKN